MRTRRLRSRHTGLFPAVTATVLLAACSSTSREAAPVAASVTSPWTAADQSIDDLGQRGVAAELYVVRHGQVIHDKAVVGMDHATRIHIASASKWLTAATVLTVVDEGKLSLDAPIRTWLPAFTGTKGSITLRQLLSHTSGIGSNACIFDTDMTMAACVDSIAADDLIEAPGTLFNYGNTSFQVAARLAEVAAGQSFQGLFEERIAKPLGMTNTRFDGGTPTANPAVAASGESTLDDYSRFLELMLGNGVFRGTQVLSGASVDEILREQTRGKENESDGAVAITGIPRYGFGVWLDTTDADGAATLASGSGSLGAYPWIDRPRNAYGLVWVEDRARSDGRAVRASQAIATLALTALDATASSGAPTPTTR